MPLTVALFLSLVFDLFLGVIATVGFILPWFAMNDIQLGVSVLNELLKITEANKQTALHSELQKQFTNLQGSLSLNYE